MNKIFWKSNVGADKNIRPHILSSNEMYNIGFTHYSDDAWYWHVMVDNGISLNVIIADDESFVGIKVILEEHLTPLDYITSEEIFGEEYTSSLKIKIEQWIQSLENKGVLEGYFE